MIFLDTNVLLYAVSAQFSDENKRVVALDLLGTGNYATSGQVHAEFYFQATARLKPPILHEQALAWLDRFRRFRVVPVTGAIVASGAAIAARYKISYWDGAILAAATEIGADTLYSEDLNNGQRYGSVRVVNPFV